MYECAHLQLMSRHATGRHVEDITVLNASGDPIGLPSFPQRVEDDGGYVRSGLRVVQKSTPAKPEYAGRTADGVAYRDRGSR